MRFIPHVTVATVVENDGHFLIVEEWTDDQLVYNQPAGHLEADESITQAARRETLEETGWEVELTAVTGIYLYTGVNGITYQRICFAARPIRQITTALDEGIVAARWMTRDTLLDNAERWRSPMVLRCIDDYLTGDRFPLGIIRDVQSPKTALPC